MAKANSQINFLDHSEEKVALYGRYLSIYLNVLARRQLKLFISMIYSVEKEYIKMEARVVLK